MASTFPTDLLDVWGGGQLMAFSGLDGPTDFDLGLTARTSFAATGLDIKLPGECRLIFSEQPPQAVTLAGDFFELRVDGQQVRGAFLDSYHLLIEGPCVVWGDAKNPPLPPLIKGGKNSSTLTPLDKGGQGGILSSAHLTILQQDTRTLVGTSAHFNPSWLSTDLDAALSARRAWLAEQPIPASLDPAARRTLVKALSQMKTQVHTPQGQIHQRWTTPDRWPHRKMWLWDSVFHAIGWRHLDPALAREMISSVLDTQRADGFIAHMADPRTTSEITQPPVLALGVKLVNEVEPNLEWVRGVYPRLVAYLAWDRANRDSDGAGLLEWWIEGDVNCRSGESGMDNSPRFDSATRLDAVDFNSFLALEYETLAHLAGLLGLEDDAARWQSIHVELCYLINTRLWNEDAGFYLDYDVERQSVSPVLSSAGFLPLICCAASPVQAQRLAEHLSDPQTFATPLPVASIAVKDAAHYRKDMWRGPVWVNVNWLIAAGFERYGLREAAAELRLKTTHEIEKFYLQFGSLFEFYDDRQEVSPPHLLRKGRCAPEISPYHQVFFDYGWTASLYVDWVFSQSIGREDFGKRSLPKSSLPMD
jgi:glycogen debranching enzyme